MTDYEDGYSDGCEDSHTKVDALGGYASPSNPEEVGYWNALMAATAEIRKLQGYIECPDCAGTGERRTVTDSDLLKALFVQAGGITNLDRPCYKCGAARVIPKPKDD